MQIPIQETSSVAKYAKNRGNIFLTNSNCDEESESGDYLKRQLSTFYLVNS
jgi:hypothetical protein